MSEIHLRFSVPFQYRCDQLICFCTSISHREWHCDSLLEVLFRQMPHYSHWYGGFSDSVFWHHTTKRMFFIQMRNSLRKMRMESQFCFTYRKYIQVIWGSQLFYAFLCMKSIELTAYLRLQTRWMEQLSTACAYCWKQRREWRCSYERGNSKVGIL